MDRDHDGRHKQIVRKIIALTLGTLMLTGCVARAIDQVQQKQMNADIFSAVRICVPR